VTRHVVQFSGGIGSWAATQRVIAEHGTADLVLLFADTKVEDDDLYRFLDDAAAQIGVPVTVVADGRTPFQVFADTRFLVLSLKRHLSEPGRCTIADVACLPGAVRTNGCFGHSYRIQIAAKADPASCWRTGG